jgi:hypothetical protein
MKDHPASYLYATTATTATTNVTTWAVSPTPFKKSLMLTCVSDAMDPVGIVEQWQAANKQTAVPENVTVLVTCSTCMPPARPPPRLRNLARR